MKKILSLALLSTTILFGAQSAMANPVVTVTLTDNSKTNGAADAASCSSLGAGAGSSSFNNTTDTCTINATNNGAVFGEFTYGNFFFNNYTFGASSFIAEPQVWLNGTSIASGAGTVTFAINETGIDAPAAPFNLELEPSGSNGPGETQDITAYLNESLVYDSGVQSGGFGTDVYIPITGLPIDFGWQDVMTTSGATGTPTGPTLETQAVPAPTPLALLGLGLIAMGGLSTIRRANARR